jgi:hypothetical protein
VVFLRDEGSSFAVPLDEVWRYLGSGPPHSRAHRHRRVRRRRAGPRSGTYSWEQEFEGRPARFTMRWHAFAPLGIAYEVLAGPFRGSQFFLTYVPRGRRTGVSVVGEFVAVKRPARELRSSVRRFFAREFREDRAALERGPVGRTGRRPRPG